jgi:thiamine-phosphate pyrophosphorylase
MLNPSRPILYLITRGATDELTTTESAEFKQILLLVSAAVSAGIQYVQLREKKLQSRVLSELAARAVNIAQGTATRVLVNDRADIAVAAGANGVHLTTQSLETAVVRKAFGDELLIGTSTHSLEEAQMARNGGANFVVFGPVFPTASKAKYGPPLGVRALSRAASELAPFPVLALGGISLVNAAECLSAGASGIAGISLFNKPENLAAIAKMIGESGKGVAS